MSSMRCLEAERNRWTLSNKLLHLTAYRAAIQRPFCAGRSRRLSLW